MRPLLIPCGSPPILATAVDERRDATIVGQQTAFEFHESQDQSSSDGGQESGDSRWFDLFFIYNQTCSYSRSILAWTSPRLFMYERTEETTRFSFYYPMMQLKRIYPEFVIGFDSVGQEDKGKPLIEFVDKLERRRSECSIFLSARRNQSEWGVDRFEPLRCFLAQDQTHRSRVSSDGTMKIIRARSAHPQSYWLRVLRRRASRLTWE